VAVAVRTDLPQSLLWCTVYCSDATGPAGRQRVAAHLTAFLQGQLDTSLLEQQQQQQPPIGGAGQQPGGGSSTSSSSEDAEEDEQAASDDEQSEEDLELDVYLQPPAMRRHWQPLLTFVTVPELPRG